MPLSRIQICLTAYFVAIQSWIHLVSACPATLPFNIQDNSQCEALNNAHGALPDLYHTQDQDIPVNSPFDASDHLPIRSASSKLYDIVSIPGKGLGLVASVSIPLGTHILNEAPLVAVPVPELQKSGYALQSMLHSLQTAFASLTPAEKSAFLSLHDHRFPGDVEANTDKLLSIFRSNAYNTGASHVGLFPKIARINHSCRPNCGNYWDEKSNLRVIYAARDIAPGEEITVSYIPLLKSTKERQARLVQYGFTCDCSACESVESSKRRERIADLFDVLDQRVAAKSMMVKSIQISIDKASKLISMLEEQQLHDYYARAYHLAAIFNERKGDLESAKKWALKELAIYELSSADSPEALEANEMIDNLNMEIMAGLLSNSQNDALKPRKLD